MASFKQLGFSDMEIQENRKVTRTEEKLRKIDQFVDFDRIVDRFSIIDKTRKGLGGRPRKEILLMTRILFVQYLYNLSDPELEDQLNDRLSFQRFVGLGMNSKVPDYTTIWRFKEALIRHRLLDGLFRMIVDACEQQGLLVKRGTLVDSTIIESVNRPLSRKRRKALAERPSAQIDTDATSTRKGNKQYYGYKGHIGVDQGSKLIRRRTFTTASPHDITELDHLMSGDERSIWADKAYSRTSDKQRSRASSVYYGVLDKGKRGRKLSNRQRGRNRQKSSVRSAVEHPFAYMKEKLHYACARAKTQARNELDFTMNCILYNVFRADFLLRRQLAIQMETG